ncbi:bcl-2-interacting killer isoform X2 [Cavia porcellus]|uniref:bcl-2-interacting killer isoform X2 n=1 Tax=Cavia porcellus TaxID=10141 RepID=UPI002FE0187B
MSEAKPVARDPLMETPLFEPPPGPLLAEGALGVTQPLWAEDLSPPGDTNLMECVEGSSLVALRLACIGDEMDLRLRSPRLAQLPGRAVHRCPPAGPAGGCCLCCCCCCCWGPCACCCSEGGRVGGAGP